MTIKTLQFFSVLIVNTSHAFWLTQQNAYQTSLITNSFGLRDAPKCSSTTIPKSSTLKGKQDDEEYIDPFISPHAYSKNGQGGIGNVDEDDDDWTPFQMNSVKDDFKGASQNDYKTEKSIFTNEWSSSANALDIESLHEAKEELDDDHFDPLLSPHAYAKGVNTKPLLENESSESEIGILLIDHGSRRASSNDLLFEIAELYQTRTSSIVKAAHMEIAPPSILDQFRAFKREGVKKIVCHPYFLSPGRHVTEDIPELIQEATEDINEGEFKDKQIEVMTTKPVGNNLNSMVDLISKMIDDELGTTSLESSFISREQKGTELGGFLGEVKRMLDEQT